MTIEHRGRTLAHGLLAILKTSPHALAVRLTPYGRDYLRDHGQARLSVALSARDLLTNRAHARARGRLR